MSIILFYYKIFKYKRLATAYHEAAHCIVAYFFEEKISIKTLTIDRNYAQKINFKFSGALDFEFKVMPEKTDLDSADHIVLIASAGICGRTIYTKGIEYVKENLANFKNNPEKMDSFGGDDDYEQMKKFSKPMSQILSIDNRIIEWSAFRWTYEYLLDDKIWLSIKYMAEALILKKNKTLNSDEIKNIINETGLTEYLESKRQLFLKRRYPIKELKFINKI